MRRVGMLATSSLVASLLLAPSAFAAKHHSVSISTKEVDVSATPGPSPQGPPSAVTAVGLVSGTLGPGLIRVDLHPLAGKGTLELFTRKGSLHGRTKFKDTFGPAGVTVAGTTTITGGTGAYVHARGTLHLTALVDPQTGNATSHQTGTLTF